MNRSQALTVLVTVTEQAIRELEESSRVGPDEDTYQQGIATAVAEMEDAIRPIRPEIVDHDDIPAWIDDNPDADRDDPGLDVVDPDNVLDVTDLDLSQMPGFDFDEMGPEDYPPLREPVAWPDLLPDWSATEGTAYYGFTSLG